MIRLGDYLELTKPNVVAVMLLTALVGMLLAQEQVPPWQVLLLGNIGIGLCAASAAAVNHLVDRKADQRMQRTQGRPLAQQRLSISAVAVYALMLGLSGFALLYLYFNPLVAWLTALSLIGYAYVYSVLLKHTTPQNIVIGGLAGAMPPLLGWVCVTGELHPHAWLLVLIIFVWTPPHFWALAVHRKDEYAQAGIPMLPVVYSEKFTRLHILLYTILLLPVTVLPYLVQMFGLVYLVGAGILGAVFMGYVIALYRDSRWSMPTFRYSIYYIMLLFVFMLADHYL